MIDLNTVAVIAVALWSGYQEYRINKMCYDCPIRKSVTSVPVK